MEYYNFFFVAYTTTQTITENADFTHLLGKNPTMLSNNFAGFLPFYSSRAQLRNATAIRTKSSTPGWIYTVGTQSVKDIAIRDIEAVDSPCPGLLTAIYHILPSWTDKSDIVPASACHKVVFNGNTNTVLLLWIAWCSWSEKLFSILYQVHFPSHSLSLHYSRPPPSGSITQIMGQRANPPAPSPLQYTSFFWSREECIIFFLPCRFASKCTYTRCQAFSAVSSFDFWITFANYNAK